MSDDLAKRVDSLVVLLNMERKKSLSLGKHIEKLEAGEIEFDRVIGNYASENARFRDRIEKLRAALRSVIDWDNTLDWEDGPAWGDLMDIARAALEGKDGT